MPNNTKNNNNLFPPDGADDPVLNSTIKFSYPENMPTDDSERTKSQKINWLMSKAHEIPVNDTKHTPLALRYLCEALFLKTGKRDFVFSEVLHEQLRFGVASRASDIFKAALLQKCDPADFFNAQFARCSFLQTSALSKFMAQRPCSNPFEAMYLYARYNYYLPGNMREISYPASSLKHIYEANSHSNIAFCEYNAAPVFVGEQNQEQLANPDNPPPQFVTELAQLDSLGHKLPNGIDDLMKIANNPQVASTSYQAARRKLALYKAQEKRRFTGNANRSIKITCKHSDKRLCTFNRLCADFYMRIRDYRLADVYIRADATNSNFPSDVLEQMVDKPVNTAETSNLQGLTVRNIRDKRLIENFNVNNDIYTQMHRPYYLLYGFTADEFLERSACDAIIPEDNEEQRRNHVLRVAESSVACENYLQASDFLEENAKSYDEYLLLSEVLFVRGAIHKIPEYIEKCKTYPEYQIRSGARVFDAFTSLLGGNFKAAEDKANRAIGLFAGGNALDEAPIATARNIRFAQLVKCCAQTHNNVPYNPYLFFDAGRSLLHSMGEARLQVTLTAPSSAFLNAFETKLNRNHGQVMNFIGLAQNGLPRVNKRLPNDENVPNKHTDNAL